MKNTPLIEQLLNETTPQEMAAIDKQMSQQTAVEWLIEKQLDAGIGLPKEWREQAKEMEKEQMIQFAYEWSSGQVSKIYLKSDFNQRYGGNK